MPESITSKEVLKFCMSVPKKYNKREIIGDSHFGYEVQYVSYSDSSTIYISSSIENGSMLNWENRLNAGLATFTKAHDLDTLSFNGIQQDGNHWREEILGKVVVGYVNVPADKKEQYDESLKTIRRKK